MVSKEAATAEALRHASVAPAGQLLPDVTVEARFGLYADQAFKTRPVWLVTFSGPGVNVPINDGPGPRPGENPVPAPTAHTDVVVIDGATGSYLEEEMFGGQ
jgi:hypothetical protein